MVQWSKKGRFTQEGVDDTNASFLETGGLDEDLFGDLPGQDLFGDPAPQGDDLFPDIPESFLRYGSYLPAGEDDDLDLPAPPRMPESPETDMAREAGDVNDPVAAQGSQEEAELSLSLKRSLEESRLGGANVGGTVPGLAQVRPQHRGDGIARGTVLDCRGSLPDKWDSDAVRSAASRAPPGGVPVHAVEEDDAEAQGRVPAVSFTLTFHNQGRFHRQTCLLREDGEGRALRIGRDRRCDIVFNRSDISGRHAELRLLRSGIGNVGLAVLDLSTNGTCLKPPGCYSTRVPKGVDVMIPQGSLLFMPANLRDDSGQSKRDWLIVELDEPGFSALRRPLALNGDKAGLRLSVRVLSAGRPEMSFTMRLTSPFVVMMCAWCKRTECDLGRVQFLFKGREVQPMQSPRDCGHTTSKSMTLNAVEGPQLPSLPAAASVGDAPWGASALMVPKAEPLKAALPRLEPHASSEPEELPSPSTLPVPRMQRWAEVPLPPGESRSLHPPASQAKRVPLLPDEVPLPDPEDDDEGVQLHPDSESDGAQDRAERLLEDAFARHEELSSSSEDSESDDDEL